MYSYNKIARLLKLKQEQLNLYNILPPEEQDSDIERDNDLDFEIEKKIVKRIDFSLQIRN